MNSIAIAFKHEDNPEKEKNLTRDSQSSEDTVQDASNSVTNEMELHINLWKMRTGWSQIPIRYFIDFGIMTSFNENGILMYVPFRLRKKVQWVNLGETICDNNSLLCAVFNEDIKAVPTKENKCFYEVSSNSYLSEDADKFESFLFYSLNQDSLTIDDDKETNGCWIKIRIPTETLDKENEGKRLYVRFRLRIRDISSIAFRSGISNDLIQAAFSKLDMYDLRINVHRNLGKEVKEKIQKEGYRYPSFSKTHVFYISNPKTSVRNGSIVICDSRIIEPDIWGRYQPSRFYDKSQIAHHWKFKNETCHEEPNSMRLENEEEKRKEEAYERSVCTGKQRCRPHHSINLFFTAKYPKVEFWTLMAYFAVIVLLGAIGSWLADYLPDEEGKPFIGWDWNVKTYIIVGLLILIVLHWLIKHIRIRAKLRLRFD